MYDNDKSIIIGLSKREEEAFKYIYDTHYKTLCIVAYEYVNDHFTARTIVSDVIFYVWENSDKIIEVQSLRNYLIRAVRNKSLNYLKHQRHQENLKLSIKKRIDQEEYFYENQSEYPLSNILEKELDLKIKNTLDSMPELTKEIFKLSRFSNLKYTEIAQTTGVSVDTVKYHIKSALLLLRQSLKGEILLLLGLFLFF